MSQIAGWLASGDLRSDGMANEAADLILQQPDLFDELFPCLTHDDEVVRGRKRLVALFSGRTANP